MYPIVQRFASSFYSFESVVTETRMVTSSTARWYFFEVGIPPVKKEAPLLQPSNQLRSNALLSLEKRRRNLSAFMQTSSAMSSLVLISLPLPSFSLPSSQKKNLLCLLRCISDHCGGLGVSHLYGFHLDSSPRVHTEKKTSMAVVETAAA